MRHGAVTDDMQKEIYQKHGMYPFTHPGSLSASAATHVLEHPKEPGDDLGVVDFTLHDSVLHKAVDIAVKRKDPEMAAAIACRINRPDIQKRMFDEGSHFMEGPFNKGFPTADQLHAMHKNLVASKFGSWSDPNISDKNLETMHHHTLKDIAQTKNIYSNRTLDKVDQEIKKRGL